MATQRIPNDVIIDGSLSATTITPTAGSIVDSAVAAGAAIDADKLEHIHRYHTDFDYEFDAAPAADKEKIVYRARGAGTIREVGALLIDTGTTTDVKFDLQKASAGSDTFGTVLTGTIDFTHADTDNTAKTGTLTSATVVAGDVFRLDMVFTSATEAHGPLAYIEVDEAAA